MAAAFGVPAVVHPAARRILEDYYRDRPGGLTEARLRMARVPDGAELIENPSSGAPGIKIENVFILAGVPHIAAAMLEALTGRLEGGRPVVSVTVGARAAESDVADLLRDTEAAHPGVAIGSYPFFKDGRYGANFVIRSDDSDLVRSTGDELSNRLREAGYEPVEGGIENCLALATLTWGGRKSTSARPTGGYDVMVACQLPKLNARVRFPLPAPIFDMPGAGSEWSARSVPAISVSRGQSEIWSAAQKRRRQPFTRSRPETRTSGTRCRDRRRGSGFRVPTLRRWRDLRHRG